MRFETGYDLTPRARELLGFLSARAACPTFEEMRQGLGLASKSGVTALLRQLQTRGYVRRLARRQRAIMVLRPIVHAPLQEGGQDGPGLVELPLLGRVPASWTTPFSDHRTLAQVWADDAAGKG